MFDGKDVKVQVVDGVLVVATPYTDEVPPKFRKLGGKWDGGRKVWTFDPRDEGRVKAVIEKVYGPVEMTGELVTLRYTVSMDTCRGNVLRLAGRTIASRYGRDYAVRIAPGVVIIEGDFPASGGRARYPALFNRPLVSVVLEIRDVDRAIAQRMIEEGAEEWTE